MKYSSTRKKVFGRLVARWFDTGYLPLLGGSWALISRVLSMVTMVITLFRVLIALSYVGCISMATMVTLFRVLRTLLKSAHR